MDSGWRLRWRGREGLLGRGESSVEGHEVHLAVAGGPDAGKEHLRGNKWEQKQSQQLGGGCEKTCDIG